MPTRVAVDDDEQIIADLQKDMRRLRSRLATTSPRGGHDAWTAAPTPATTYQLTTIPVQGTCEFAINGHEQREGTDYTVDYSTGLVTVSASLASGDKLVARYLVTDWLVARSLPAVCCDTTYSSCDTVTDAFNRADAGDGTLGTSDSGHRWTNIGAPFDSGFWTTQGTTGNTAQAQVPTIDHYRAMATLLNAHGNNQDISVDGEAANDNSIGILARFSADGLNGYHVLYTAYNTNNVFKFVNGTSTLLGSIPLITPNTAFTGRVTIKDNLLKVYLNGTLELTVTIDPDDANCHCETDWTYLGFREDHGGPGGSAPSQITVYANTHWDNLSVVAP